MANKFIITTAGEVLFGNVGYHDQLLPEGQDTCYGGGFWQVTPEKVYLSGSSFDFGGPKFEEIKEWPLEWKDLVIYYEGMELIL